MRQRFTRLTEAQQQTAVIGATLLGLAVATTLCLALRAFYKSP